MRTAKDENFFNYGLTKQRQGAVAKSENNGRISNSLSKIISYKRDPSLFDEAEITERDKEAIQELKEIDALHNIERKGKPVVLSSYENRVLHALSYAISQEMEEDEDIKKKVNDPFKDGLEIKRVTNITPLCSLIYGSARKRYKKEVIAAIYNLSQIRQVQIIGDGDRKIKITAPLLMVGRTLEDLSPEKRNKLVSMEIYFGSAFFHRLNNRFSVITPKLFKVWRKGGRGTELFSVLLSSIYSVYWLYRHAAEKAEERVKGDTRNKNASPEEFRRLIAEARKSAMTYELDVANIKQRVTTDYESKRSYKAKFWIDLDNTIDGLKELNLITEVIKQRGARGQEKVIFILSETYNLMEKPEGGAPLLESPKEDGTPAAF